MIFTNIKIANILVTFFLIVSGALMGTLGTISIPHHGDITHLWPACIIQVIGPILFGIPGVIAGVVFPLIADTLTNTSFFSSIAFLPGNFIESFLPYYFFVRNNEITILDTKIKYLKFMFYICFLPRAIGGFISSIIIYLYPVLNISVTDLKSFFDIWFCWISTSSVLNIIFGTIIVKSYYYLNSNSYHIIHLYTKNNKKFFPLFMKVFIYFSCIGIIPLAFIGFTYLNHADKNPSVPNIMAISLSIIILTNFVFASIFGRIILNPLLELRMALIKATQTEYLQTIKLKTNDELGEVTDLFNQMIHAINSYQIKLKETSKLAGMGETVQLLVHDLRKPVILIKNYFESYERGIDKSLLAELKLHILDSIQHVEKLLNDVTSFSRETPLNLEAISFKSIIKQAEHDIHALNKNLKISFLSDIKNRYKPCLDPNHFLRVVINIITNAIEAKQSEPISIVFRSYNLDDSIIEFIISNDGPFISEDLIHNIFDAKFTTKNSGVGLGLASCKKIIHLHGGEIFVKNNINNKTVDFIIKLSSSEVFEEKA